MNLEYGSNDKFKIYSNSSYTTDDYYSTQDYNRFVSDPLFVNTSIPMLNILNQPININNYPGAAPGGMFCDPQLGCSDRMLSADISKSNSSQFYQELRIQSKLSKNININLGYNYLNYKSMDKYYVFNNMFTLIAQYYYAKLNFSVGMPVPVSCPAGYEGAECVHVEMNSMKNIKDEGHNYFLSKNRAKIESSSIFGEIYYDINDELKLTIGGRYTDDSKISSQIPSQLLLGGGVDTLIPGYTTGGKVNSGYPELENINQNWKEITGRFVVDWKPDLSFTDDTLIYASLSRGYKGGGTNPPRVDINQELVQYLPLVGTFKPEKVIAYEVGSKNTFMNGKLIFNISAFLYDYDSYQISQIVDRIAFNENFDAKIYGVEIESALAVSNNLKFTYNMGYLQTRLGKGSSSIDVMNRTQGNPDWVVLRPWLQAPSNCIAPKVFVEKILLNPAVPDYPLAALCPGGNRLGDFIPETTGGFNYHSTYGFTYNPFLPYNADTVGLNIVDGGSGAPNSGRGFSADLSDHSLPNAPKFTMNFAADVTYPIFDNEWIINFRADYYYQSKSFSRIYNTEFDRIRGWDNVNLAFSLSRKRDKLDFQIYVKNIFNKSSITDSFTNADDTGLSTNVFNVDPRIIGLSISKKF